MHANELATVKGADVTVYLATVVATQTSSVTVHVEVNGVLPEGFFSFHD